MSQLFPCESNAVAETIACGERFAATLKGGDVIALYGDMGAGKTHFVKGICQGLGFPAEEVSSPTFTIVNEYHSGRLRVYHFDAYRITHLHAFYELGYEAYLYDEEAISIIEWPTQIESLLPAHTHQLRLTAPSPKQRMIEVL